MSGAKTVVALIDKDGAYIDALNPLPTSGGGGGGGAVTQGAGSGVPTSPWSVRISNGTAFLDPLTDAQLRASPVPVSLAGVATLANQTNGTQRTQITDGTNNAVVSNTDPSGTEYGLGVRPIVKRAATSSITSPIVTTAFASILAANSSAKLRMFYNPSPSPVGITLGGSGAVSPGMVLAPGQTWIMPQGPDGFAVWTGIVNGTVDVGTTSIIVTEIT